MPTTPVSERILANLVSTLQGVSAGASYFHTFRKVAVIDGAIVGDHKMPAAFIRPLFTDMDGEGQTLTNAVRHEMRVSITIAIDGRTNGATKLEELIRDTITAVYVDRQRGTYLGTANAVNTIVDQVERSYPEGEQLDTYLATLVLRIMFRTQLADLGVSL